MRVYIQKPDLDTCLSALILGVTADSDIYAGCGDADTGMLADPSFFCIEAGGSGQAHMGNFDHHDPAQYWLPACRQALDHIGSSDSDLIRMVEYICAIDEARMLSPILYPSLSTIFSGMLLCESDPIRQFVLGIEILSLVLALGADPFGQMPDLPEWARYRQAKVTNRQRLNALLETAQYHKTKHGNVLGILRFPPASGIIGGIRTLYEHGANVVMLYDTTFGSPPVQKFTVAGNGVDVSIVLPDLILLEDGWGGRETIIGSPRSGSVLAFDSVVNLLVSRL
jgi:hypothetical protein